MKPLASPPEITAATITDAQIRALREALFRESGNQMTDDTDATGMALTNPSDPRYSAVKSTAEWAREYGRARCADDGRVLRAFRIS